MRPSSSWSRALLIALLAAGLVSARVVLAKTVGSPPAHSAVARAALPACTIVGTNGPDRIVGTPGNDVICAKGGDDVVHGGGGNDVIFGGGGRDTLFGGSGDDELYGGEGDDRLYGEAGDDLLQGGHGSDLISGGAGTDTVDYSLRVGSVRVALGGSARNGAPGERDDIAADVENVLGGKAADVLIGDGAANALRGNGGADVIAGRRGDDTLDGGRGNDRLVGGRGDDRLFGGPGRDRLDARDGSRFVDRLSCGRGRGDTAMADPGDRVAPSCENVHRRGGKNHAPTDIRLSNASVPENQPVGTTVGALSAVDRDRGDQPTFALVSGPGSADNASFRIVGAKLVTNAVFDYETKHTYSVRIRVNDHRGGSFAKSFTISVTDLPEHVNHAPTDISLSGTSVDENQPPGTTVGTLSATDADAGDTHTFTLVAGVADNAAFKIVGSTLKTNQVLDFETKASYAIRVQVTDSGGAAFAKAFTITVNDLNDPPTADARTVSHVGEDGSQSISLSGHDQEGAALTFHVAAPPHGALDTTAPAATCDGATPSTCTASVVYTPAPDFNGDDSFTYTVNDGAGDSSAATVSITVDPVNDTPQAANGSATTDEDVNTTVDLGALVSDVETSDANLTYEIVTLPAHGQLTGTGPTPTYTPDANFNGADSFTYRVTDRGDPDGCTSAPCDAPKTSVTRTVAITVNPVNDVPQASDGTLATDEDIPAAIDLTPLVFDVETSDANLTYDIVTPPAHGQLTGSGSTPTYTPDADFNGLDSFTYRVIDRGDPDGCTSAPCDAPKTSSTKTVSITVNAVNDAPVNTLPVGPVTTIRDTDTPIGGISIADVDAGSQAVQVVLSVAHGTLTVSTSVPFGVDPLEVPVNGASSVTVTAPLAAINATFADANGIVYHSDAAYTGPDTLTVATDDLGHTGAGGNKTDTDTLALDVVPPNTPPVAAAQSVTTNEDTAKTITLSGSDADGDDPLSFAIASPPAHGSLGSLGAVTCDHATPNTCTADVTYTPDANYNGPDQFRFHVNDGRADSPDATVSLTVNAVNDAPSIRGIEATALAYTENDPATQITAAATVSDVDSANFDTGTLTVDFSAGGTVDDRLEITNQGTGAGQIGVSGSNVTYGEATIGTFAGGSGTTPLVITLNANADAAATQALVRAITYRNVSDNPSTAARTVRFVLTDGDGGTSAAATRPIALTAVNDTPTLAGIEGAAVNYVESVDSAPSQSQITNTLTVSDPDSTNLAGATVQITSGCQPSEDVLVFSSQNGITGNYTAATCLLTLTGSSSLANYQTALRSLKYEDTSDTPNTTTRTVTFQVDDGQSANHASNTQTRDVTVTPSNDSPTGAADTFNGTDSALAGVTLAVSTSPSTPNVAVSGNLLNNDTDPDTPHANLTASAGTASSQGGVIAVNSDGTFTYTPAPGFTGTDTFTYTLHDNGSPDRTDTATVTINVAGPRVWFVDDSATSAGANGTSAHPLTSLAPLSTGGTSDTLDGSGDVIFVYSGTYTSGIALENSQKLVGQPQGLSVTNANGTYNLVAAGGTAPAMSSSSGPVVGLASGNDLESLALGNAGSGAASLSGASVGNASATSTTINNTAGKAIDIDTGTLGMAFDAVSSAGSGTEGVKLTNVAGSITMNGGSITNATNTDVAIGQGTADVTYKGTITDDLGTLVSVASTTGGTKSFTGAITDGGDGDGDGISLTSNTGATINFSGGLTLSTGANPAFTATGGGTVNVTGTNTIATTSATALNVANTTIGASGLTFQSISAGTASGSAGDGIVLDTTGSSGGLTVTGTGTAGSGGTIQHKTGADGSTTAGIGIYLNNTSSVSLARMQLNDFDNFAIRGTSVTGLTLSNSTINGSNGTSTAVDEASMAIDNLTGSGSITNDNISGGVEDDVRIQNSTGSLNSLSITGSTFATTGAATANDALALLGKTGASVFNATVQNNSFTRAQGDLYQYTLETGTGTMHFDSNTVTNNFPTTLPAGGGDINVSSGSLAASAGQNLQYSINNNNVYSAGTGGQPPNGSVIVTAATPKGSATGTIQNNTIGTTGVTQSGGFDSILADAVKAGFHKVIITGNTIRRYKEAGIRLLGVSPTVAPGFNMRATVKGNTITEPDSVAFAGIDAEVGGDPSDIGTMCLDLGGTTAADKNSVSNGDPGNFNDINLVQQFATSMNLPGYAGAATDDAAVQSFVAGRNNGDGTPTVSAIHDTTTSDGNPAGSGFTGAGTDCS